jgi:hypothetical protein
LINGGELHGAGNDFSDVADDPIVTPFKTRAEALAAEREWLRKERGL